MIDLARKRLGVLALIVGGALLSSCGGLVGSCDTITTASVCIEYRSGFDSTTALQTCSGSSGTYYDGEECGTVAKVTGKCEFSSNGVKTTTHYYTTGGNPYNTSTAQNHCQTFGFGTWDTSD